MDSIKPKIVRHPPHSSFPSRKKKAGKVNSPTVTDDHPGGPSVLAQVNGKWDFISLYRERRKSKWQTRKIRRRGGLGWLFWDYPWGAGTATDVRARLGGKCIKKSTHPGTIRAHTHTHGDKRQTKIDIRSSVLVGGEWEQQTSTVKWALGGLMDRWSKGKIKGGKQRDASVTKTQADGYVLTLIK